MNVVILDNINYILYIVLGIYIYLNMLIVYIIRGVSKVNEIKEGRLKIKEISYCIVPKFHLQIQGNSITPFKR